MKSFLSEVSRLDSSKAINIGKLSPDCCYEFFAWKESKYHNEEVFPDTELLSEEDYQAKVARSFIAGLALKHDNPQGKFFNDHLWYLYFDRYAYDDPKSIKSDVTVESDLSTCLAILDLDYVLYHEAFQIACSIPKFEDVPVPEILFIYQEQIVHECYKNGKFETPIWKIENNIISSRNK